MGDVLVTDMSVPLSELFPALSDADVQAVLTAYIVPASEPEPEPEPVYKLSVTYRLPLGTVSDAGYLGLWKHTDTEDNLSMRSDHSTSAGRVGYISPDAEFVITEFYEGTDYLWGKTTYNGITGWCALSPEWSAQLTSGVGTYTVDAEGYLIYTTTGERVTGELDSTAGISELLDTALLEIMRDGITLDGWSAEGRYISDAQALITELVPSLREGDVAVTLSARMTGIEGDADGNGTADAHDLDLIIRYLSGYDDSLVLANLDLDSNGKINTRDFILVKELIS